MGRRRRARHRDGDPGVCADTCGSGAPGRAPGGPLRHLLPTRRHRPRGRISPVNLDDCATRRLLSDKGRASSRAIGEAIRALDVPIGPVLASPLCRTVETAVLAFGFAEKSMATREGGSEPVGSAGRYAALRALLSTAPPAGKNTAIIGHGYPYYSLISARDRCSKQGRLPSCDRTGRALRRSRVSASRSGDSWDDFRDEVITSVTSWAGRSVGGLETSRLRPDRFRPRGDRRGPPRSSD